MRKIHTRWRARAWSHGLLLLGARQSASALKTGFTTTFAKALMKDAHWKTWMLKARGLERVGR